MKYLILVGVVALFACIGSGEAAEECTGKNGTACCDIDGCAFCLDGDAPLCVNATTNTCTKDNCTSDNPTVQPPPESTTNSSTSTVETTAADVTTTNATTEAPAVISTATSTETIVASTNGSDISTPEPGTEPTSQSTAEPTTTPTPTPSHCDPSRQHFDAASFIGGIVLCGAVIAIAFFGCKFYKQRSETKYQQF